MAVHINRKRRRKNEQTITKINWKVAVHVNRKRGRKKGPDDYRDKLESSIYRKRRRKKEQTITEMNNSQRSNFNSQTINIF